MSAPLVIGRRWRPPALAAASRARPAASRARSRNRPASPTQVGSGDQTVVPPANDAQQADEQHEQNCATNNVETFATEALLQISHRPARRNIELIDVPHVK